MTDISKSQSSGRQGLTADHLLPTNYEYKRLPAADRHHLPIADHIETVKERIMQQCLSNLFSAPRNVTHYRDHGRRFVAAGTSMEGSATHVAAGLTDHITFKSLVQSLQVQQVLRDSGLTSTEIDLMLRCDRNLSLDHDGHKHDASSSELIKPKDIVAKSLLSSLEAMLAKLSHRDEVLRAEECQPESFHDAVVLSRRELEEAVLQGRLEGGGEAFVRLQPKERPAVHPDHPLNHLVHLERQLFPPSPTRGSVTSQDLAPLNTSSPSAAGREDLLETLQYGDSGVQRSRDTHKKQENLGCKVQTNGMSEKNHENDGTLTKPNDYMDFVESTQGLKRKISPECIGSPLKPRSMWDVKEAPIRAQRTTTLPQKERIAKDLTKIVVIPSSNLKNSNKKSKKDYSQGFVSLPNPDELIPLSEIKANSMSINELQEMFPRYCPGQVSSTLYIKNLSVQCTPQDLVNVFGHFDNSPSDLDSTHSLCDAGPSSLDHEPIEQKSGPICPDTDPGQFVGPQQRVFYRLLQGRMRGQAFIRFPGREAATAALQACLGYELRGKPMVIEYGKEKC